MSETETKILALATQHMPALEGVPAADLRAVRVVRTYSEGVHPHEQRTHVIAFAGHLEYPGEEIYGYLTQRDGRLSGNWGWGGCEVNGVVYESRTEANRVRATLAAAGMGDVAVMHPDAQRVLRAAGL